MLRLYYPTMFNDALAKWMGCSKRTLNRKAKELGLKKVDNFNSYRADAMSELLSAALKKAYRDGRKTTQFIKGVRNNPDGEFRPGHHFDAETEEARKDKIRKTFKDRKAKDRILTLYGMK